MTPTELSVQWWWTLKRPHTAATRIPVEMSRNWLPTPGTIIHTYTMCSPWKCHVQPSHIINICFNGSCGVEDLSDNHNVLTIKLRSWGTLCYSFVYLQMEHFHISLSFKSMLFTYSQWSVISRENGSCILWNWIIRDGWTVLEVHYSSFQVDLTPEMVFGSDTLTKSLPQYNDNYIWWWEHTEDGREETPALWEAEHVCVDDLPAVILILHNVLIIVHVIAGKVVLQHTGLCKSSRVDKRRILIMGIIYEAIYWLLPACHFLTATFRLFTCFTRQWNVTPKLTVLSDITHNIHIY